MDNKFVKTDSLFARIQENLSFYSNNGVLDTGKFYQQVKLLSQRLGLEMYIPDEDILYLKDHKAEMPCNFYMMDSAWLCKENGSQRSFSNEQGTPFVWYEEITDECVSQNNSCGVSTCSEKVLRKMTRREFIDAPLPKSLNQCRFNRPLLLTIKDNKTLGLCAKDCGNLFPTCHNEVTIRNGELISDLSKPIIYIRYYGYPIDDETGLPLILDNEIVINAIEKHLMHYFFELLWLNNTDQNLERKIQYLQIEKEKSFTEAQNIISLPSFRRMVEVAKRYRQSWRPYNLSFNHY